MHRLLIVEDDNGVTTRRDVVAALRAGERYLCSHARLSSIVPADLAHATEELIIAVVTWSETRAPDVLEWLGNGPIAAPVLLVLPADANDALLHIASRIADDFVVVPFCDSELRRRVDRLIAERPGHDLEAVRQRLQHEVGLTQLVGRDPAFVQTIGQLLRFARADVSVCISGETGTGKELCARALHHLSRRPRGPFIAVDCGALPEQLFENEVFGHARGAFTDAHRDHRGLVAMADGGTLFLDEVDALPLTAQAKLLRFLQEHTFRPLGSDRFDRADVRVVAATNRDLDVAVQEQRFRQDLYFRLNVLHLHLPPLRERRGDIELLACNALRDCGALFDGRPKTFSLAALRVLTRYDWPGNVRELLNVVQRAVVACDGDLILPCHIALPTAIGSATSSGGSCFRTERAAAVALFERRYVEDLLRKHGGNVTHAARDAQQDRRAFGRFIKKYRIDRRTLIA